MADTATTNTTATPAATKPAAASTTASTTTPARSSSGMSSEQRLAMLKGMDGGQSAADAKAAAISAASAKPAAAASATAQSPAKEVVQPQAKPAAKDAAGDAGGEAKPSHEDTAEKRAELVAARRVMYRQGFTDEDLKTMDPARMLERAAKFAKDQEARDKAFQAKSKTKPNTDAEGTLPDAEGDTAARRSGGARKTDDGEPGGNPAQTADLDTILDDLVLDKDDRKRLTQYDRAQRATYAQWAKAATEKHAKQIEAYESAIDTLIGAVSEDRAASARSALSSEFPGLKDDAAYTKVLRRVGRMDPSQEILVGSVAGYQQLWRDACYIEFGPVLKEQARNELLAGNAASRDGQPDGVGVRPAAGALTAKEHRDRLLSLYDSTGGQGPEFERGKAALGKPRR